ncbi:bifunctional Aspartic peptidase domain superfamily/Aspartic peptidase A1 family/Pepsin-like domain/Aspartic peptidase [Babesia duncani]|uniref:Bifunctional Aspartic peptidase domain superfamily/Aspartic peptidase A1 family/Pepsin-like domain/Aspartic peptidase n=1 Tax=Babesia duncani TaxID=323732 RepID=A0AAD9UPF3_9APIC|nr:bifunctional Aspartic peptidase domain superfamily/Aspartic peptidase A1 family/Pepsin-like domain/Aspartic peptidase [Babesia duncani]
MPNIALFLIYCVFTSFCLRLDDKERNDVFEIHLNKGDDEFLNETLRKLYEANNISRNSLLFAVGRNDLKLNISNGNKLWTTYFGNVRLGNGFQENTFKVLFDTGSSEFWVPDEKCTSAVCLNHKRLANNGDWTPKVDAAGNFLPVTIRYLSGEIEAIDGVTNVDLLNGISLKDANVTLAKSITAPILNEMPWDGILGLGFPTSQNISRKSKTFLEKLLEHAESVPSFNPIFSYYISKNGGSITFGGFNPSYKKSIGEDFKWAKLAPDSSYWSIILDKIVTKRTRFNANGLLSKSLTMNPMEHMVFHRFSNDLELTPDDYILSFKNPDGSEECACGIVIDDQQEDIGMNAWTFGEVFLRAYYTVYDFKNRRVGFVPSKREVGMIVVALWEFIH